MLSRPKHSAHVPVLVRRLKFLAVFLLVAFGIMIARLWQLQLIRGGAYLEETQGNIVSTRSIPPIRGKIFDRAGRELASNRPAFSVYADVGLYSVPGALEKLSKGLNLNKDERESAARRLLKASERGGHGSVAILEDQSRERVSLIRQDPFSWEGLEVRDEPYRDYPEHEGAAHIVGFVNQVTEKDLEKHEGGDYLDHDRIGRYGVERALESHLRGKRGSERYVVNARGKRVESQFAASLIDGPALEAPSAGHDVILTLDLKLQAIVEKTLLRHAAGAFAVVDVHSGEVLALASTPAFDPNEMSGQLSGARYRQMLSDPRKPFVDKTLRQHYPPGSTYKFVTALAALENDLLQEDETLKCHGRHKVGKREFRCTRDHGKISLVQAIKYSCNVFFWKLSERVGIDKMAEVAYDFGFGEPTGLGLNGDVKGHVPTRAWYEERDQFRIGYTLNAATGQGDVEVSVLQLATAYAAIANGGALYQPQVIREIRDAEGTLLEGFNPRLRRRLSVSPLSLGKIREGMKAVVNEKKGTGYRFARSSAVTIAGKTGTAQVRGFKHRDDDNELHGWDTRRDHAWFAGYAPADDPEVAFVVLIEHGGSGGREAGPIARDVIDAYAKIGGLKKTEDVRSAQ